MQKLPSILLIDDDSTTNFLNERMLERLAVADKLLVAESGEQALELLNHPDTVPPPSLILLDVNMPGLTGIEFLEQYQAQRQAQQQPTIVVMLTTTMDSQDLARINELHIDGLVSKPLTEEKIEQLLQLHFRR